MLDLPGYKGPYKAQPDKLAYRRSTTPDDQTIVFHLKKPFGGFDYFAQLPSTMPVPQAKDTGAKYKEHVVSTGPYMFETNEPGKSFTLVRNPNWDQATDPNRKALPDRFEVSLNVNADDIDNRMISGDLDVDIAGTGVQPAALGRVLADPTLKAQHRQPRWPRGSGTPSINARRSRRWTTSTAARPCSTPPTATGYQRAYGGDAGGDIATNLLPPLIPGCREVRPLPAPDNKGDLAKAKDELTAVRPARTASPPTSPTAPSGPRRRRPPRRCSSRSPGSASS